MKAIAACLLTLIGSVTTAYGANSVTHSHDSRSHAHPLPAVGINHTHNQAQKPKAPAAPSKTDNPTTDDNASTGDSVNSARKNTMTNLDYIKLATLTDRIVDFERQSTEGNYIGKLKAKDPNAYQNTLNEIGPGCEKAISSLQQIFDFEKKMDKKTYTQKRKNIAETCLAAARTHLIKEAADIRAYVKEEFE
uniref:Uncharacterized protein n=1 Tax=uncultured Thiotrichaceae bacterium TaxID=298394 RepID=A0A6S6UB98_9GAMM|nr:MAG: Unknown protein [uncultured Thiotrichaceae bacterium]